jgi:predicted type IV restriction endonuclease
MIVPVLEALGWDNPYEVLPEDSPNYVEDWIDYFLKPDQPNASSLCVEAKPLLSAPPRDRGHEQIKKGLEQTEARGSDYFIWTNGDTWQLFAVKLPKLTRFYISSGNDQPLM